MFLTWLMLAVALLLSAVAAFYSIVGLAAIFAAAVVPIVIMGSILEIAKLTVTVWLHEYWKQCKLTMKLYLVPAVFILMVITSMGIFGFLSKAHLDQTVPTGDVAAQVSLIDEKINNERETIANARSLLQQLDKAVQDIGAAADREVNGRVISSAERALQVRRQQARDRIELTRTIESAQTRIVKLQEEKAPVASQLRAVEAEVGPVKYIAALIYGDDPDANLLEKAVRWVIILLVVVFDPLAIMMLLAFTESYRWERDRQKPQKLIPIEENKETVHDTNHADDADITQDMDGHSTRDSVDTAPVVEMVERSGPQEVDKTFLYIDPQLPETLQDQPTIDDISQTNHDTVSDKPREPRITMGNAWPPYPHKGDIFIKTTSLPTTLYKFNNDIWIQVDKNQNDLYYHFDAYIDHLISKISSGEYDPELLTEQERLQIETKLKKSI